METDCINWTGLTTTAHGITYGVTGEHPNRYAHRIAYENANGPIPKGLVIDHLCRNGLCINPEHLEAVTNEVNILRGNGAPAQNARKTHCSKGHPYAGTDLYLHKSRGQKTHRLCRSCRADRQKRAAKDV